MFKQKKGPAPLGNGQALSAPTSHNSTSSIPIGNLVASRRNEDGSFSDNIDVAVIYPADNGEFRMSGKKGTDFEGYFFKIFLGKKGDPRRVVISDGQS